MMQKRALNYTTDPKQGSFANLFNPMAAYLSLTDEEGVRIPAFMDTVFVKGMGLGRQTVGAVTHMLASAGLIAGGIGLIRYMSRRKKGTDMVTGEKLQSMNMSTVGDMELSDNMNKKSSVSASIAAGALPVVGMIALSEYILKDVNDRHKKEISASVGNRLEERKEALNSLVMQRIRSMRGGVSDKEYADLQGKLDSLPNLSKSSSLSKRALWPFRNDKSLLETGAGYAGAAAAFAAILAGLASYEYVSQNDDGNKRLKAYEKGLKEYARQKAISDPVIMQLAADPKEEKRLFAELDRGMAQKAAPGIAPAREEPGFDSRLNKPVSVTLD